MESGESSKNMNRKITVLTFCAMLFALCFPAEAQQPKKVPRIGFTANNPGTHVETFRRGLRDLGYVEGKNILVEYRYIEGDRDRIPSLVSELLQLNVDILVATSPPTSALPSGQPKRFPL